MGLFNEIELDGAAVAVTGGARGIGRATAEAFAQRGAAVTIGDLDAEAAQESAARIGRGVKGMALDVTSRPSFAEFAEACGEIDVLVNNAGIMPISPFLEEDDRIAAAMFAVNVHGPSIGMKLVLPGMIERGRGHVVNVASYAGKFAIPGLASYCASKAAAIALNETVALELNGTGVTVTAILPSAVQTELASGVPFPFERVAKVEPEVVAAAIVRSLESRPLELAVPRWLGAYEPLTALLPSRVERLVRNAMDDDRALTRLDAAGRAAYTERISRQTRERADA